MKLIHAADLHLDSPLRGLARYEGAPVERIRLATREAFVNLIDLCLAETPTALLLAGDVFDGDWRDFATGLFFAGQLQRLREVNTQVVLLHGNHDAASPITRELDLPKSVHVLSATAPETVHIGDVAVHGQSFIRREVSDDLAAGYPEPVPGLLNIGLLHTALTGRPNHAPYAPTRLETLVDKGYQYWALGHVHQREVVHETPYVIFSGNLQGRHIRETGPKGATLIESDGVDVNHIQHRVLDVVRWAHVTVDVTSQREVEGVLQQAHEALASAWSDASPRLLAARVEFVGRPELYASLLHNLERFESNLRLLASDTGDIWLEKIVWSNTRVERAESRAPDHVLGDLFREVDKTVEDEEALLKFAEALDDFEQKLPSEAKSGEAAVDLKDPAYLADAVRNAAASLLPALLTETTAAPRAQTPTETATDAAANRPVPEA